MSGHSKWSTIKRKKAMLDSRRGKLWSKLSRNITIAAKSGDDPDANPTLRLAIDKAKDSNMPKDTIEKAIQKGAGGGEGANYEEILYEGYGPGGVAVMCQILTDNRHRIAPEIKKIFEKRGGNLGASNSVAWMFTQKGQFIIQAGDVEEDKLFEVALEAGATDVTQDGEVFEITCEPSAYQDVRKALEEAEIPLQSGDVAMVPANTITLDAENGRKLLRLVEELDEHDDVQNVYANFDIPEDVVAEIAAD